MAHNCSSALMLWSCQTHRAGAPHAADSPESAESCIWDLFEWMSEGFKGSAWQMHRLLLACGGVDGVVRLLLRDPDGGSFTPACKLLGHQDWVRCVAFRQADSGDAAGKVLLLALDQPGRHSLLGLL
jgi:hypothetical protein